MMRIVTLFAAFLAVVSFHPIQAQCSQIANTGCPGSQAARCMSQPHLGMQFDVRCHPCNGQQAGFVIVGTPRNEPVSIAAPIVCDSGRCGVGCTTLFVLFPEDRFNFQIPNDSRLVGTNLCVQCGCLDLVRPLCVQQLSPAVRATIQR